MRTKNLKNSPAEEDDVKEDDVEMTGGGIESVFFSVGKQQDTLKKKNRDKTLENTLKASTSTKLSTCDDKGVFIDDDDTLVDGGRRLEGERLWRRWL